MARSLFLTAVLWRPGEFASALKFCPSVLTLEIVRGMADSLSDCTPSLVCLTLGAIVIVYFLVL